jgi:hypothetical protein
MCRFRCRNIMDNSGGYSKGKCFSSGKAVFSRNATSAASAPNQHQIQFQLSSTMSARLDVAIVSHFRFSGSANPEHQQLVPSDSRCHHSQVPVEVTLDAVPLKGQRFRGRQGRQQHSAMISGTLQVPTFSALTQPRLMQKGALEDSRRKLYELRRAERQRLDEAEFDRNNRLNSDIDGSMVDAFADEDDGEGCAVRPNFSSSASISVNSNDFEYHVNVAASLASRQRVGQLIENGMVSVNGSTLTSKSHILTEGTHAVCVTLPLGSMERHISDSSDFPFPILYEDDALLVICKPSGIVVHPTPSVHDAEMPSVVSRLLQHGFLLPASQSAIHRSIHKCVFLKLFALGVLFIF